MEDIVLIIYRVIHCDHYLFIDGRNICMIHTAAILFGWVASDQLAVSGVFLKAHLKQQPALLTFRVVNSLVCAHYYLNMFIQSDSKIHNLALSV